MVRVAFWGRNYRGVGGDGLEGGSVGMKGSWHCGVWEELLCKVQGLKGLI